MTDEHTDKDPDQKPDQGPDPKPDPKPVQKPDETTPTPVGIALVTTFGLGNFRPAPGTWGSLPPCVAAGLWHILGGDLSGTFFNWVMLATVVFFSLVCLVFGRQAEARFGKKDPSQVVADETAGQAIPLLLLPGFATDALGEAFWTVTAAFILFRVFDITKPPPARNLQKIKGGAGILIDDLIAGVMAAVVLQVGLQIFG